MLWRTLRLVCASGLLALLAAPACGGSSSDSNTGAAGSAGRAGSSAVGRGGAAGAPTPNTVGCGTQSCTGVVIQNFALPACCADEDRSQCGLDSTVLSEFGPTFEPACQPLAQPGTADASCPASAKTPVDTAAGVFEIQFPGCCRADHSCGYDLNTLGGVYRIGLGCVDATSFLDGGRPQPCGGPGAPGAGGESGNAGAGD